MPPPFFRGWLFDRLALGQDILAANHMHSGVRQSLFQHVLEIGERNADADRDTLPEELHDPERFGLEDGH